MWKTLSYQHINFSYYTRKVDKIVESGFICPLQKISLQGYGITYLK